MLSIEKIRRSLPFLTMALPGFILVFVLAYIPMAGVILAFKHLRFDGGFISSVISSDWVGLSNFRFLFGSHDAWVITRNTIAYNSAFLLIGTISSILLAIALSYLLSPGLRSAYQTMILFPHFISWVVVSYFSFAFLQPSSGILNQMLSSMGFEPVDWYSNWKPWPWLLVIINNWKGIGFGASLYLASILAIDKSLYEAAWMDGANMLQEILYITMPQIKRLIIILTLLAIGNIFRADFGLFYQIPRDNGILYPVTDVIDTYVYRSLMSLGDIPMSTAAGLYQSLVGFLLIVSCNSLVKRFDKNSGIF